MKLNLGALSRNDSDTVDLADLLEHVGTTLRRYVVLGEHEVVATTLWVAHTHAIDAAEQTPYLHITSPEKRSGKSRLFEVLELLVARAWVTAVPSDAVIYRKIDRDRPTLLMDEVDALFGRNARQHEELRAILNAGHRRGAKVDRCNKKRGEIVLEEFEPFGAKALAGIREIPDTLADRSIRIEMKRRARSERVERFRIRAARAEAAPIHDALQSWASAAIDELRRARPQIPFELHDRAADGWEPLLAIADAAGGEWPMRARAAAIQLSGAEMDADSAGIVLLERCKRAFEAASADRLTTQQLLSSLIEDETAPFGGWWGRSIDGGDLRGPASKLGRMLHPYGIRPRDVRFETGVRKGYHRADFEGVWERYVAPSPPSDAEERDNATPQVEGLLAQDGDARDQGANQARRVVASLGRNNGHGEPDRAVAVVREGFGEGTKEID